MMNCVDIQTALWLGLETAEMEDHIRTCADCQNERGELQAITHRLSLVTPPAPSKSLLPRPEVIRSAVQKRQAPAFENGPVARRWFGSARGGRPTFVRSAFAGVAEVMAIAAVAGFTVYSLGGGQASTHGQSLAGGNHEGGVNVLKGTSPTAPTETGQVDVLAGAPSAQQCALIQQYYLKRSTTALKDVQHMDITGFYPDQTTDGNTMSGRFDASIELKAGAVSPYHRGNNSLFALFAKQGGVWTVVNVASSPFSDSNIPAYYKDFEQKKILVKGTIVGASEEGTGTANGETVPTLMRVQIRIDESDAKRTGQGPQVGQTVTVEMNSGKLPPSMNADYLKAGTVVAVYIAQADPAMTAGMTVWYSRPDQLFYLEAGKFHELNGGNPVGDIQPTPAELAKH